MNEDPKIPKEILDEFQKRNEYPCVHEWADVELEVYCMLNIEYGRKCSEFDYVIETNGENVDKWGPEKFDYENWKKIPNPEYDPNAKPDPFPENCKKKVTVDCLDCDHVAYCTVDWIECPYCSYHIREMDEINYCPNCGKKMGLE